MQRSNRRRSGTLGGTAAMCGVLLGAAFLCAPLWAAEAGQAADNEGGQPAVWTPKELRFVYQGFTTKYSCDGLRDKVKAVLLQLGARKDLEVRESPCTSSPGTPNPFPGVTVRMNVLTPPGEPGKGATNNAQPEPPVVAHWKTVEVAPGGRGLDAAGDCELVEQIKQKILPFFTARNVDSNARCVPHQMQPIVPRLRADVLVPEQKEADASSQG